MAFHLHVLSYVHCSVHRLVNLQMKYCTMNITWHYIYWYILYMYITLYIPTHKTTMRAVNSLIHAPCVYVMYLSWGMPVYCAVSECYAVSSWAVNMWCHKQVVFGRRKAPVAQLSAYLGKDTHTSLQRTFTRTVWWTKTLTHWNNKHQQYLWLFGIATHQHSQPTFHTTTQALWRTVMFN